MDGLVTLREAITSANNNADVNADVVAVGAYGTDTINFNIAGTGVHTIAPSRAAYDYRSGHHRWLHAAGERGEYTDHQRRRRGAAIELNGANTGDANGFSTAGSSAVRGLVINRFTGLSMDAGKDVLTGGAAM